MTTEQNKGPPGFTEAQKKQLAAKLNPDCVSERTESGTKLSYIEGWWTIAEANRIFGFDGWTRETVDLLENTAPTKNQNQNNVVSFRAKVRVSAGGIVREGIGFGSGIAKDIHKAYESAIKEAETDAMKRALMTFGNPFGLALYDKTKENVGIEAPEPKPLDPVRGWIAEQRTALLAMADPNDITAWREENKAKLEQLSDQQYNFLDDIALKRQHFLVQAPSAPINGGAHA